MCNGDPCCDCIDPEEYCYGCEDADDCPFDGDVSECVEDRKVAAAEFRWECDTNR